MIALSSLIQHCVPHIAQASMMSIVKVESRGNPLALGLNKGYKLQFQPQTKAQAHKWVEYLDKHNYNFDIGLAQVNIKNINKSGFSATDVLDPCTNLKLGSSILIKNYTNALVYSKSSSEAWQKAISAYNTGNFHSGFTNGYVSRVYVNRKVLVLNDSNLNIPPIIDKHSQKDKSGLNTPSITSAPDTTESPYRSRSLLYIQPRKPTTNEINSIKVTYYAPAT